MYNKRSVNLCSTYILPLIGLNPRSFGESNFINSYVNETDTHLIVELNVLTSIIKHHPDFNFEFSDDGHNYAVFELPSKYKGTIRLFREGRYSEFPEEVKAIIRKKSGLRYRVIQSDGTMKSARELLALDKDKELRKAMEKELEVRIAADAELASIPGEDNFFNLNLTKSVIN